MQHDSTDDTGIAPPIARHVIQERNEEMSYRVFEFAEVDGAKDLEQ